MDIEARTTKVALEFAQALVARNFGRAHAMLAPELRNHASPDELQGQLDEMTDYGDGPPQRVEVMNVMQDWPAKQRGDIGWAYASISGDGYGEAVTVIVTDQDLIREIEWGRP